MKTCDHILKVHAYHDGELPTVEIAALEAHVRGCESCAAELAWLQKARLELRATLANAPLPSRDLANRVSKLVAGESYKPAMRLAWELTAAAAAILLASVWQLHGMRMTQADPSAPAVWEELADPRRGDASFATTDEQRLARWIADDLSGPASARVNEQ